VTLAEVTSSGPGAHGDIRGKLGKNRIWLTFDTVEKPFSFACKQLSSSEKHAQTLVDQTGFPTVPNVSQIPSSGGVWT